MTMYYPKLVLLIDDDEEDHFILSTALTACCETVELIYENSGTAVLKRLHDNTSIVPDMVFLDWYMPKISGKELLTTIRQIPSYAGIPVIIYSGTEPKDFTMDADKPGITHFLRKAAAIEELQQKLETLFSQDWKNPVKPLKI